jgi:hypothetical protein
MNYETNPRYGRYLETLIPLVVESAIVGVLVNLISDYVASRLQMDVFSVSLLLFLLLAIIAVYALFQSQWSRSDPVPPQKPSELGTMLSLMFFTRLLFLNCSELAGLDKWLLIGIGAAPYLSGLTMTSFLNGKYHKYEKELQEKLTNAYDAVHRARQEAEIAQRALKEVTAAKRTESPLLQSPSNDESERRIHIRSVLQGNLDVKQQPGVLLIIMEAILSAKKTVTQMEIFEACRSLTRNMPVANLLELIRDLMGSFVNLRQIVRGVNLITEDPTNWRITESNPYWKKNS